MNEVKPKVMAGAAGAGGSMPIVVIFAWILELFEISLPPHVSMALGSIITSACALGAAWLKSE